VRYPFILFLLFSFIFSAATAQERPVKAPAGPLPVKADTIPPAKNDALHPPDSLATPEADSTLAAQDSVPPKSDIETTINYTARDSIRATLDNKMIWLYGDAKITYGAIELEADEIIIDYANNTLTAHGSRDSLGNRVGYPVFKNGAELYETKDIVYNFKTKRARISEVVTKQGEGIVGGDVAFKNEKNEMLSLRNSYTTCDLEHPHFVIRATKTKAIPNDKIVSGPFYIEFNDIPLPLGFLFGMFPAQRSSSSGIIFPSYGEERRRGFNLRNGGYFFDINDYVKLSLTGDIYSKGGHAIYAVSNYIKRYKYSGNVNFAYSRNKIADNIENPTVSNDFRLTWSHSPQSKGTGRFGASVTAATTTYTQNNNLIPGLQTNSANSASGISNMSSKLNSNISYSKRFAGTPLSMGLNLSHNQDLQTRQVDLTLPNLTLNMTNLYPFQRKGKTGPLDNISISYQMSASNRVTNNLGRINPENPQKDSIAPFTADNFGYFFENGRKGIKHSLPVSYSFKVLRFFTISPSVSLDDRMYFEKLKWDWGTDTNGNTVAKSDTITEFNHILNYSFSTGMTTRIYGTYFFKRGSVKALRHIINPSISFGYTPDFSTNPQYFDKLTKSNGVGYAPETIIKSRHEGFINGGSTTGRSASIGFGLGNNLEMKIKSARDTAERKVMLLNNLSISSSYNIVADSFKLAPFSISANTNVLNNKLNVNLSSTLDPYLYHNIVNPETQKVIERREKDYAWKGGGIGRITSATLAVSTNLNPAKRTADAQTRENAGKSKDLTTQQKERVIQNANTYVDFSIPWSLNVNYNLSYGHQVNADPTITQSVTMSGDLSLTEKWKLNFNTGYHFESGEFTQTSVSIARDLHCWTMNLWWVPFGRFQSYNFTIAVKASVLKDLKLERRQPYQDRL
jgi:hypothetical protein